MIEPRHGQPAAVDESRLRHGFADLGDVRLHYVEVGSGPLVLLLHGFPEFWYSWRHQLLPLADAGFRVVAPDLRGYNLSSKPAGVDAYRADRLAADVGALIDFLGADRAVVVGHDWGAIVAWLAAIRFPDRVERLAILNGAHLLRYRQELNNPRQLLKSWYVFFFQLPWLPEVVTRAFDCFAWRWLWRHDPVRAGAFSEEDIDRYVGAWLQPGAATATINSYRALGRQGDAAAADWQHRIEQPVLVIWGEQDRYLIGALADPPAEWVANARVVRLPDASHWVQVDRPGRVNELLLEFLAPGSSRRVPVGAGQTPR